MRLSSARPLPSATAWWNSCPDVSPTTLRKSYGKGVRVVTTDNVAHIDIFVILKLGVNVEAVRESLTKAVTYSVEKYTGMRVKNVTVNVVGVRV